MALGNDGDIWEQNGLQSDYLCELSQELTIIENIFLSSGEALTVSVSILIVHQLGWHDMHVSLP